MCSCDTCYVAPCGIMLTSLFENNKDSSIDVYIFIGGTSTEAYDKLSELADIYGQNVHFINIDDVLVRNLPIKSTDRITKATYYRLFSADYLPQHIEKILYLDCDIIVNKSLSNLYNIDITNYSAAVVLDSDFYDDGRNILLGIKSINKYFNAGVMLINLSHWRNHNLTKALMTYANKHIDILNTHDQDVLNGVLQGSVLYLPLTYNYQTSFLFKKHLQDYGKTLRNQILSTNAINITIIHYTAIKPWSNWHFIDSFSPIWQNYKKMSLWKDFSFKLSIKEKLFIMFFKLAYTLGLKNRNTRYANISSITKVQIELSRLSE